MTLNSQQYHGMTSYQRNRIPRHFLDWQNQPTTFKTYPNARLIQLPKDVQHPENKFSLLMRPRNSSVAHEDCDLADLSRIFQLAYGITGQASHSGGAHYYRSVASAGALYPSEVYVATKGLKGLRDGLYHFSIAHHALTAIRSGEFSAFIANALSEIPSKQPIFTFFLSVIFFRSAWKYRERAYRYHLLDTGHLLENLVLGLKAQILPFALSYDFEDHAINRLLGLDEAKEVCLAVCTVPGSRPWEQKDETPGCDECEGSIKDASKVSNKEIDYPLVRDIHRAGITQNFVPRGAPPEIDTNDPSQEQTIKIDVPGIWPKDLNIKDTFFQRRSRRNFIPKPISQHCLSAIMECLSDHDPSHVIETNSAQNPLLTGLMIGHAEGIESGFYWLDRAKNALQIVMEGFFTEQMAHTCLDQKWLSNAAIHVLFMGDLNMTDKFWGPRGYRHLMMHSGRLGERLYMAATAMGLGCCGIGAFYDSEAMELLNLKGEHQLLYLVALGPVKSPH